MDLENRGLPFPSMHEIKPLRDLLEGQGVRHELIHFQLLVHVLVHQFGNAVDALVAWEKSRWSFSWEESCVSLDGLIAAMQVAAKYKLYSTSLCIIFVSTLHHIKTQKYLRVWAPPQGKPQSQTLISLLELQLRQLPWKKTQLQSFMIIWLTTACPNKQQLLVSSGWSRIIFKKWR